MGNGNGAFQTAAKYTFSTSVSSIVVADFNGDRKADLAIVQNALVGQVIQPRSGSILLGNGDGTFRPPVNFGSVEQLLAAGDFNGDGKTDLVIGSSCVPTGPISCGPGIKVLLGNNDGTFQPALNGPQANSGSTVVADLNADGSPDLVVGSLGQGRILLGRGSDPVPGVPAPSSGLLVGIGLAAAVLYRMRERLLQPFRRC